ncbi:Fic/DOC family protein [Hydrogenimonas cancrithermarum]|uniref:protein adenylyltransferase n=1 Tax=Hydrogenimonas cancrithermarum TaxID=2993563 RepID=A0ABM8FKX2_9BACT|nr:Fic family protein [Hydrogenimonas cancrithermarum]BDY12849.1 putative adenosine monophosphate-protein transferase y4lH [Hydrogenimonas cancrithermarum]BDY12966.1 putative adenosine monophosphate-protein transferase y4lH [Hydrogenimonas cancrithermarum]
MSKYRLSDSPIYYPGTDVPVNKLGIEDSETIHALESELLYEAYETFISELDETTQFDENYFKSLHYRTFSPLYEWAGEYRTFDMAKGDSLFCRGLYVASESQRIFSELKMKKYLTNCQSFTRDDFARELAYFKCELIALHPFYELNGRITRLFFDLIATYNGYHLIDYSFFTPREYIEASIRCVRYADEEAMRQIVSTGLKKRSD